MENTSPKSLPSSSSASSLLLSDCKIQFNQSASSPQSKWIRPERGNDSKCSEPELDKYQRNSEVPEEISKLSIGKCLHSRSSNQSDVFLKKSLSKTADVQEQVMNSFQAKDFLRKFGISEKGSAPDTQEFQDPLTTELILMNDSVLFVSEKIPPPIYNLQDFDVPDAISQFLKDFPSLQPRTIQAYCWRPAIRGKDIIGIAPQNSGKTWAYLVPILSNLCQYTMYADIQYSNGPLAIILVSSWIKAEEVYEQCRRLASAHKDIVVEVIYGGGAEHNKSVSLLNGCHILVATLPCLSRMMINQYTNLNRLCHLIIDEADIILEDFYSDIRDLMRSLKKQVLLSKQRSNLQNQVMIFGSNWTSHVRTFAMNALEDVVIVITDMIEASTYGRVKQIPMITTEDGRERKLIELLPDLTIQGEKVIIFTDGDQSCHKVLFLLNNYLTSAAIGVWSSSYLAQREESSKQWHRPLSENEPYRFLVCPDSVLCDLKISDATCIVHYQFPSKKVHVGLRMQTMSKYYPHYNDKTVPLRLGKSYILMSKMDLKKVKSLKSLLLNNSSGQHRDETIKFFSSIQEENERNPDNALCYNIKMYGKCRSYSNCNQRHSVLPGVDLNGCSDEHILLPHQGDVRIMVLHVKSASHFFGRILEIWQGQKKSVAVHSDLVSLTLGMATHFCDLANKKPLEKLEIGTLCAVNTSKGFFRVKLSKLNNCATKNTVTLFFVDIGKTEEHPVCNLYTIPDQFARVPYQAVEIFLCRLQPVDCDVRWSNFANSYTNLWVESKMLYGKIQFVTKNSLWLDPLLERIFLKDINSVTNGTSLRRELLDQKLAVDNPEHLVLLREKFRKYLPDEKPSVIAKTRVTGWESDLSSEQLVPEESNQNVVISYIVHPGHFYVQKVDKLNSLSELMEKIEESVRKETKPQPKRDWTEGLHCLAIWSDSLWHRVRLTKVTDSEADVHFVDRGSCGMVPLSDLRTMSQQLMCLPAQAIRCHLAHISPVQGIQLI
ncbi:putative ATP-dependent RNA helicase TDRD12 [Octopus sinensis]|uniref:RNA helicase n=1 Tax=Octopus sinensis TaxID=2607531 RepID=A0A7E6FHJ0_9MOLL|nr:putative ATP-dependent RNA helicase TDRD12 [Octopus sinensis]